MRDMDTFQFSLAMWDDPATVAALLGVVGSAN